MAPIRQPATLQALCIESGSHFILQHSWRHVVNDLTLSRRKVVADLIRKYIPNLMRGNIFHSIIKMMSLSKENDDKTEMIIFFFRVLVSPVIQHLSFSDLIYGGSVSYEELDAFETCIGGMFPSLPHLTHLDLSTHRNEVSLPSCSCNLLWSVGENCPNLRILNLNNNNRVTDEGLRGLAPHKFWYGCPFLEEIYIQECSVTHKGVIWLLRNFRYMKKIGYSEMGIVLGKYTSFFRKRRSKFHYKPRLNLTYFDNSESASGRSDKGVIRMISEICPSVENIKVRVCDEDCFELRKLPSLEKLELRFYTGVHHPIGNATLTYFRVEGMHLSSLTIFCHELRMEHVAGIAKYCLSLSKLFLHCNTFTYSLSFENIENLLDKLQVLSIRIGQEDLDETHSAGPMVEFLMGGQALLEEVYLLFNCKSVNFDFFKSLLFSKQFPNLQTLIYDSPRRVGQLPVIPLGLEAAVLLIESCPSIINLGNLISWQVIASDVHELKNYVKRQNYDVNVIYSLQNKMNSKYF